MNISLYIVLTLPSGISDKIGSRASAPNSIGILMSVFGPVATISMVEGQVFTSGGFESVNKNNN